MWLPKCHPTPCPGTTVPYLQATELYYHRSALLVLASTVVAGGRLPPKLNCVRQHHFTGTPIPCLQATELYYHRSALLVLASTVVAGGRLPPKLNCVLQNLMAGLRREPVRELQDVAAEALAELMVGCAIRQPCPNEKLVKNLCGMLCGDPSETPCAAAAEDIG